MVMVVMVVKPARTRLRSAPASCCPRAAGESAAPPSLSPAFLLRGGPQIGAGRHHHQQLGAGRGFNSVPRPRDGHGAQGAGLRRSAAQHLRGVASSNAALTTPRAVRGCGPWSRRGAASSRHSYTSGGEENELSGTRPLATPVRERSSRSVGSRDGLSGSVELEAALRAVERNFLQPSLRRLLWASSASYNTHNNSLTQSLSNQCFRSGLNCLRQFHIG